MTVYIFLLFRLCLCRILPPETSIFTTSSYPNDQRLMATLGNGYVGLAALSDSMYIGGVFNGPAAINETNNGIVSHRARIPSTNSFGFNLPPPFSRNLVLDVNDALYREEFGFDSTQTFVNHTVYAHQKFMNLLVTEINVDNTKNSNTFQFGYYNQAGKASKDINFTQIDCPQSTFSNLSCSSGWTQIAEYSAQLINVALVHFDSQQSGTLNIAPYTMKTFYFPTVILTTLDIGITADSILKVAVDQFESLYTQRNEWLNIHVTEWENIWQNGRIDVIGNESVAASVYSSLYYIYNSIRSDWPYGLSPGSLSSNAYNGHTFWDMETWMFPPLLMLQQGFALSCIQYRNNRLHGAQINANLSLYAGSARYPWESGFVGIELCPNGYSEGEREIHINADIPLAIRQFFYMTQNETFLKDIYAMLSGMCMFLSDWSYQNEQTQKYEWLNVQGPDEYYVPVNNSAYTNYAAVQSLIFCIETAERFNKSYPDKWTKIVNSWYLPFDDNNGYHPESDNYAKGQKVKQADTVLLYYPFQMNVSAEIQMNDLSYYQSVSDPNGPAMTWAIFVINWIKMGGFDVAQSNFAKSYKNIQSPFNVWTETAAGGGSVNFITGAGGFLQQFIFGYPQLRIHKDWLSLNFSYLPWPKMALVGVDYNGNSLDFMFDQLDLSFSVTVTKRNGTALTLIDCDGHEQELVVNKSINVLYSQNPIQISGSEKIQ